MIAHPWILAMIGYLAGPLLQQTRSLIEKDAGYRE
jgi:hypothetical protein